MALATKPGKCVVNTQNRTCGMNRNRHKIYQCVVTMPTMPQSLNSKSNDNNTQQLVCAKRYSCAPSRTEVIEDLVTT